jgi:hypothetical protein
MCHNLLAKAVNVRLGLKCFAEANAQAYFSITSQAKKEKVVE